MFSLRNLPRESSHRKFARKKFSMINFFSDASLLLKYFLNEFFIWFHHLAELLTNTFSIHLNCFNRHANSWNSSSNFDLLKIRWNLFFWGVVKVWLLRHLFLMSFCWKVNKIKEYVLIVLGRFETTSWKFFKSLENHESFGKWHPLLGIFRNFDRL